MTQKSNILTQLQENFIFAVVRGNSQEEGYNISESCISGGIKNIEVTYTTPQASEVIRELSAHYKREEAVIGAGTVLDAATTNSAILAGAEFVVSPHFDESIAKVCNRYGIPYLPGCGTVTEIVTAMNSGADVVKLFPGGLLGSSFIKDVHGPLPFADMMPSGGVSIDNVHEWVEAGAWSVGVGSALTKNLATEGYDSVKNTARCFVNRIKELR